MPPKKKQTQEEAKRLEEQRKRLQEEQAKRQLQRKQYMPERLPETDLLLPASKKLIIDFPKKKAEFLNEKLKEGFNVILPNFLESQGERRVQFILKELHYYIKDAILIFGEETQEEKLIKHRIFVGILFTVLINGLSQQSKWCDKNKAKQQILMKELVSKHCKKYENKTLLNKSDGLNILNYASQKYFGRFKLISMFDKFSKAPKQTRSKIYLETPSVYINTQETKWVDLTENIKQNGKAASEQVPEGGNA